MPGWFDTTLQAIGAVASVATLVGVVLWLLNRKQVLAYERLFTLRVLDNPSADRITVTLDGQPFEHPSLSALRVWNAGWSPIRPEDFAEPLRLLATLNEGFAVVNIEGINGPAPNYVLDESVLVLDRLTLSRGQGFEVRALVEEYGGIGLMGRLHNGHIEDRAQPFFARWRQRWRRRSSTSH